MSLKNLLYIQRRHIKAIKLAQALNIKFMTPITRPEIMITKIVLWNFDFPFTILIALCRGHADKIKRLITIPACIKFIFISDMSGKGRMGFYRFLDTDYNSIQ
ncbi:MAG: hypothetical protein KJ718_02255 [Nanoarchaeota archaeon]|nr:hypothetical protein [Nanoarchaeota archaeon]